MPAPGTGRTGACHFRTVWSSAVLQASGYPVAAGIYFHFEGISRHQRREVDGLSPSRPRDRQTSVAISSGTVNVHRPVYLWRSEKVQ